VKRDVPFASPVDLEDPDRRGVRGIFSTLLGATISLLSFPASTPAAESRREFACQSLAIRYDEDAVTPRLLQALCAYFDAENRSDWRSTYRFRSSAFQKRIPFELYSKEMSRSKAEFEVVILDVLGVQHSSPASVVLSVDFYEMRSGSGRKFSPAHGFIARAEELSWANNGKWICRACGHRGRFGLNGDIVQSD